MGGTSSEVGFGCSCCCCRDKQGTKSEALAMRTWADRLA